MITIAARRPSHLLSAPLALAVWLTASAAALVADEAAPAFPHQNSELKPDPTVVWGRLDNGLRYCLMPNQQPKDKASLRLQVQSGSLLESDAQRGLAHYLEHMAFNGSTHFPAGTLITTLQKLGLSFGADTNAHTSFDETVYKLEIPDTKAETIATALTVMADYAGGMLIEPAEVDRERGVILAEMRDRNSPGFRQWQALYAAMYPGMRIPGRFAIGLKETVEGASPALLKAYYDEWYRPERMVLTVVGAIAATAVEAQVKERFAGFKARTPAPADPGLGALATDELRVLYHHEAEADGTELALMRIRPDPRRPDSAALRRESLAQDLAERNLSRRLRDFIEQNPQGALISASASSYRWLDYFHAALDANVRPGKAAAAIAVIDQELRRFLRFGPTAGELDTARAGMAGELDTAVAQAQNRSSASLGQSLYTSVHHGEVFMSPAQDRDLLAPMIAQMQPGEVQQVMVAEWASGHQLLAVTGRDDLGPVPAAEAVLRNALLDSRKVEVAAPATQAVHTWAYGQRPAAAMPTAERSAAFDITEWEFANHARVNCKHTDFKPGEVLVQLRLDLPPTPVQAGVLELASRAFLAAGLGKHSAQELREVLAGKSVHLGGLGFDEAGAVISATCLPKDVELCFQELHAYLTDAGWRPEAEAQAKSMWIEELKSLATNLDGQVDRTFTSLAVADTPRRRGATLEEAEKVDFAAVRAWLEPYLRSAPLTLNLVGDIDPVVAKELVAAYIGSLPERQVAPVVADVRAAGVLVPAPPLPAGLHRIDVPGTVARAVIDIAWPTDDYFDVAKTRRLGVLASVFTDRMRERLRQEFGDAYSPHSHRIASETYAGFGYLLANADVTPERAEPARAMLLALAQELADKGVSDDQLVRAKTPLLKSITTQRQQNGYWLSAVMSRGQTQPQRLEWAANMEADYAAITTAELSALAKQYLVNEKALQVVGVCQGKK